MVQNLAVSELWDEEPVLQPGRPGLVIPDMKQGSFHRNRTRQARRRIETVREGRRSIRRRAPGVKKAFARLRRRRRGCYRSAWRLWRPKRFEACEVGHDRGGHGAAGRQSRRRASQIRPQHPGRAPAERREFRHRGHLRHHFRLHRDAGLSRTRPVPDPGPRRGARSGPGDAPHPPDPARRLRGDGALCHGRAARGADGRVRGRLGVPADGGAAAHPRVHASRHGARAAGHALRTFREGHARGGNHRAPVGLAALSRLRRLPRRAGRASAPDGADDALLASGRRAALRARGSTGGWRCARSISAGRSCSTRR